MTVLFIDKVRPVLREKLEAAGFICSYNPDIDRQLLLNTIDQYDGIVVRSKIKLDKEILERADKLKFIARAGAGLESIDVTFAENKGIKCFRAPEGNQDAVGEHAIGMLLMLFNQLKKTDSEVRQGKWLRNENMGIELSGKTVGIIGYGYMGSAFAKKLQGFDVTVLAYDKYKQGFGNDFVKEVDLATIQVESDILSIHTQLTEETHYMVNADFINAFSKPFYLINTARGKIVNTSDLVEALEKGKVLGACLDVLEYEGISFDKFEESKLPPAFLTLSQSNKVIFSPHVAGFTEQSHEKIALTLAEKILTHFAP